jgi:hypothetical protein
MRYCHAEKLLRRTVRVGAVLNCNLICGGILEQTAMKSSTAPAPQQTAGLLGYVEHEV